MTNEPRKFQKVELPTRKLSRYESKPKATNPIRKTQEYKDFQKAMIQANPICAKLSCKDASTDIHHKVRITDQPELALDPENVICVCHECHLQIESAVNRDIDLKIWKHLFRGL